MNVSLQAGWITAVLELAEAIESGGDVSELVARIEANESDISSNTSDISTLTSALSDLGARVTAIEDAAAA